jgi:methyl-accepting chemotaxis protein
MLVDEAEPTPCPGRAWRPEHPRYPPLDLFKPAPIAPGTTPASADVAKAMDDVKEAAEKERVAAEILRRKVDHLLEVVAAAAQGDLTRTVKVEGTEPVDELAAGIKKMLEDLAGVIGQITESVSQFNEGSRVIAESSQSLASGAQQQSSSVEEMTASIEELARSIEGVKENSVEADKMARRTSQLAEHGGEAVKKSIEAMELIRTSSQQDERLLILLDIDRLFASEQLTELERAAAS